MKKLLCILLILTMMFSTAAIAEGNGRRRRLRAEKTVSHRKNLTGI